MTKRRNRNTPARRELCAARWRDGWHWAELIQTHKDLSRLEIREIAAATGVRLDEIPPPGPPVEKGRLWTPEEVARLEALCDAGASYADMARELRRTYSAVKAQLWKLADAENTEKQARVAKQMRSCLTCDRPFQSEGKHNRVCKLCKETGPFHGLGARATAGVRAG
jgi:hypothetical protein